MASTGGYVRNNSNDQTTTTGADDSIEMQNIPKRGKKYQNVHSTEGGASTRGGEDNEDLDSTAKYIDDSIEYGEEEEEEGDTSEEEEAMDTEGRDELQEAKEQYDR